MRANPDRQRMFLLVLNGLTEPTRAKRIASIAGDRSRSRSAGTPTLLFLERSGLVRSLVYEHSPGDTFWEITDLGREYLQRAVP